MVAPVGPISTVANSLPLTTPTSTNGQQSFGKFLEDAIGQANSLSQQADALTSSYAAGGSVSVDQMMIAEQKATLALDTVVQVRDRIVSAYQSIMNMQV